MICLKRFGSILLVLFLVSVACFSLSQEEIDKLPTLQKETLISIILEYDKAMLSLEQSTNERMKDLDKRKSDLDLKELLLMTRLAEQKQTETLLIQQEELFQISLEMQKKILIKNSFAFGIGGLAIGIVTGHLLK